MEIDSESFSCDIVIEEKFIPDVKDQDIIDQDVPKVNFDQISDHKNQDQDQNQTENNEKSQISQLFNGEFYKCVCKKRFMTHGPFKKHEKICTFQKSNLFVCRAFRCYETFDNQADFEAHKHNGLCIPTVNKKYTKGWDTIGNFTCDHEDCTAKFTTKRKIYQHKRAVHIPRKFACLYCDLTFKKRTHKIRHEKRIHFKRAKKVAKKHKKLEKTQEIHLKKPKIVKRLDKSQEIHVKSGTEVESNETSGGRITRSQNKRTSFANFFESEKITINQPESDGDTSTTASFIDQDIDIEDLSVKASSDSDSDENNKILKVSKRVHNNDKLNKPIELQDSSDSDENDQVLYVSKQKKSVKKQIDLEESDEYWCSLCRESFSRKIDAKNHEKKCQHVKKSKKIKMDQVEFRCEYEDCAQVFTRIDNYNCHIDAVHLKITQNQNKSDFDDKGCFLCRKNFKLKRDLEDHMKLPHKITCSKCSRIFVDSVQLERHTKYEHLENLKKFQCPKCTKKFMTEQAVKKHNHRVHVRKTKICPICLNELQKDKFIAHLENHKKGGVRRKLLCESCQVYMANKSDFEKHMGTEVHLKKESDKEEFILPHDLNTVDSLLLIDKRSEDGLFDPVKDAKITKSRISSCNECGLKFRNFFYRETHRVKMHGYQKPEFYCKICDMNFSRQGVLNNHIKTSTGHKIKEKELWKN